MMRSNRLFYLLLLTGFAGVRPLLGQDWQGPNPTHCVEEIALQYARIADLPFLASWKFTGVYRYPDGSIAPEESLGKLARGASLKSFLETDQPLSPGYTVLPDGSWKKTPTSPISNFTIEDFVKRTVVMWHFPGHDAVVAHMLPLKPGRKLAPEWAHVPWIPDAACGNIPAYTVESLGTRTILGIEAIGVRASRPIKENEGRVPGAVVVQFENPQVGGRR